MSFHRQAIKVFLIGAMVVVVVKWCQLFSVRKVQIEASAQVYSSARNLECSLVEDAKRMQCFPDADASEAACAARGCCWREPTHGSTQTWTFDVPQCYFPVGFPSYQLSGIKQTSYGHTATMVFSGDAAGFFRQRLFSRLSLNVYHYPKAGVVRIKIGTLGESRYEVPLGYPVHIYEKPQRNDAVFATRLDWSGLTIADSMGRILFDTKVHAPIVFAEQFLQISTLVNASLAYGFGEVQDQFAKPTDSWHQYSLFASSILPNLESHSSLSGVHPFALLNRHDASSYGLFLANSNAMEIEMTPYPALTYRTIGGILDFYVYVGPTSADVVKQHLAVIGRPSVPPYWALGFHLSRYGYRSAGNLQQVIDRNLALGLPYEVQWLDTDTLRDGQAWTYDPVRFAELPEIVAKLHAKSMRVVVTVDPTVKTAAASASASEACAFVKDDAGRPFVGQCKAGKCVYADFSAARASECREAAARASRSKVAWDGLLLDANEPTDLEAEDGSTRRKCRWNGVNYPAYVPNVEERSLVRQTLCMDALHNASTHYNLHNLYGHFDAKVTSEVMQRLLPGLRPFVISRSTFAGTGRYAAHWTGHTASRWDHMAQSIVDVLNMNLFGIAFVGADVCGFRGDASEELCVRWMQLGSFYPFMRNHNDFHSNDQDPAVWSERARHIIKAVLTNRYELLPYFYTMLFRAFLQGETVVRPLFFEFPSDFATHTIQRQFMLGPNILVAPVLEAGATSVTMYYPAGHWYDKDGVLATAAAVTGQYKTVQAPLERIPFYFRGGTITPCQFAATNTELARRNTFFLVAALDDGGKAAGELTTDDGVSSVRQFEQTTVKFFITANKLKSTVAMISHVRSKYSETLSEIRVFGVNASPVQVSLNFRPVEPRLVSFNATTHLLIVKQLRIFLLEPFLIEW